MMFKIKFKVMLIATLMVFMSFNVCNAEGNVNVVVDGNTVNFDEAQPFIDENDRTLVPVRFISESLGAEVDWNQELKEVTITKNDKTIKLTIGDNKVSVNDEVIELDTQAILQDDRTFVPVAFISETLNTNVNWNNETRTVEIKSNEDEAIPVEEDTEVVEEQVETDGFIEPKISIVWNDGTSHDYHFYLKLDNYKEYKDAEDTYKVSIVCTSHDKLNSSYYHDMWGDGDWIKQDLTEWKEIKNKYMKIMYICHYIKPAFGDENIYTPNIGDIIKYDITFKNEATGETKVYKQEVKFEKADLPK